MRVLFKYILLLAVIELSGLSMILLVVGYKAGFFNPIELLHTTRGPYEVVYLPHSGRDQDITAEIERVNLMLYVKKVQPREACGIFYNVRRGLPSPQPSILGGFLVQNEIAVPAPYGRDKISAREVIVAHLKAHPELAPLKVYPQLRAWIKHHHFEIAGPALEIYRPDGTIEFEVPIQPLRM